MIQYHIFAADKRYVGFHQRIPYPPMIKLEIQPTTFYLQSTEVPVEIVGIREAGKTFILNPKLRPGQSTTTRIHIIPCSVLWGESDDFLIHCTSEITYNFDVHMCNTASNNH